ncbi:MAG: hypothetical protein M1838_000149 [Thelocarpon superellum]|nr:MAG: hypothetical protein M1838_000149 [Thelocarpon superellum]
MSATPPHRTRQRLRHFLHPDGRKIHIALSHQEADSLKRRLEALKNDEPFDVHIQGSPEHLEALRTTHSHHERARDQLRAKHAEMYEEFEKIHHQLDDLAAEISLHSEHDISLDANFSKYGYSAHLRATSEPMSSGSSMTGDGSSDHVHDWDAERNNGQGIKFYKKPVVRQYHHKGLIWRASTAEEVASFELFVDLLYVGLLAIIGDAAVVDPDGESLLRFAVTFILSWKIWTDLTLVISWFETDDILQRICVLFIMGCLFGYTSNIVESPNQTYPQLIAFYLAARLFEAMYYIGVSFVVPILRAALIGSAVAVIIPSSLWIASIYVEDPRRQGLIWVAIILDHFGPVVMIWCMRGPKWFPEGLRQRVQKLFEFYPAVNIEHKTQRTGAFVTLVFGYSVVALIYQNRATVGLNAFFGKAILGLVQAFIFNWLYFDIDDNELFKHAIRRHVFSSMVWITGHLPFIMSFTISAAALSRLVVAHDCSDANVDSLSEDYLPISVAVVGAGLRWYYCAGLGLALACMGLISASHIHKDIPGARIRKRHRLMVRFAVAVILITLPLATSLNSLQLISTTTGLLLSVLCTDIYGLSCIGHSFFTGPCNNMYLADCPVKRKELERAVLTGEVINVQSLADRVEGEKGVFHVG